jgi:YVTN family beta-propeller protein
MTFQSILEVLVSYRRHKRAHVLTLICVVSALCLIACSRKPAGPLAYVTNERDGTISVIDLTSNRLVSTIILGARPRGIQLGPDKKTIWVALSYPSNQSQGEDKIVVID